ncbi:hypothetical protein R1flu_009221 [Riccia fluitans]|uniref:PGG domain-containing protein n=1 Tax=Riccia fluitans TaxID=41844 RepID=A0ABD1Z2M3_9MARC
MEGNRSTIEKKNENPDPLQRKYEIRVEAEKKTQQTLQRMQKDFVGSINAYALVLVLLATVTYAGFLQPPGGVDDDKLLLQKKAVTVFIVFNSLSFFVSVADLLLCVISSLSPLATISTNTEKEESALPEMGDRVGNLNLQMEQVTTQNLSQFVALTLFKLICVNALFAVSLTCCVVAFGAAGFVVVDYHHYRPNFFAVVVTAGLGGLLFSLDCQSLAELKVSGQAEMENFSTERAIHRRSSEEEEEERMILSGESRIIIQGQQVRGIATAVYDLIDLLGTISVTSRKRRGAKRDQGLIIKTTYLVPTDTVEKRRSSTGYLTNRSSNFCFETNYGRVARFRIRPLFLSDALV